MNNEDRNPISILNDYKNNLNEFEKLVKTLENDEVVKERDNLILKNKKLSSELKDLKLEVEELKKDKNNLHSKLFDVYYSQKEKEVGKAFNSILNKKNNYLFEYEKDIKKAKSFYEESIIKKISKLEEEGYEEVLNLRNKTFELSKEIDDLINKKKLEASKISMDYEKQLKIKREELINKEISIEEMQAKSKNINFEFNFGTKITNVVGIILVMLGLMYATYLSYNFFGTFISDKMKTILIYLVGLSLIGVGEYSKDKVQKYFSTGLFGGGIGILYLGTAVGYFVFDNVLNSITTVILIAIISVTSFLLATRNDMKPISIFALIGGYLPLVELKVDENYITAIIIYITALNLLALGISVKKGWRTIKYISFGLNLIVTTPLVATIIFNDYWNFISIILYTSFLYTIYLVTAVYYPIKNNLKITMYENVLFVMNTLVHSIISFTVFYNYFSDYLGYFAIILFFLFFLLGKLIEKFTNGEKVVSTMLYSTAFLFSFIAIPIQFGGDVAYISTISQGAVLVLIGIYNNRKVYKYLGTIPLVISLFYIEMLFDNYLNLGVFVVSNISIIVMFYYMATKNDIISCRVITNIFFKVYKSITLILTYGFLILFVDEFISSYILYYFVMLFSLLNILIVKVKLIHGNEINYTMIISSILVMPVTILDPTSNIFIIVISKTLYLYSIFKILEITFIDRDKSYMITAIAYVLIIPFILVEGNIIYVESFYFSLIGVIVAAVFIVLGFKYNFSKVRKTMLISIYLFLAKIFFLDFSSYTNIGVTRVISLIVFGVILIFVSYMYQKFSKQLLVDIDLTEELKTLKSDSEVI